MANTRQGLYSTTRYRYSIKQLLELANNPCLSFDLSKFSYDAARAGVVPPLSSCAIVSRKGSGSRQRDWSIETTNTMEDSLTQPKISMQQPTRDPVLPPTELLAQKDRGFARFLRKHSSPTHNRVTAGGRIVPIESRTAPPAFMLNTSDKVERHTQPKSSDCNGNDCHNQITTSAPVQTQYEHRMSTTIRAQQPVPPAVATSMPNMYVTKGYQDFHGVPAYSNTPAILSPMLSGFGTTQFMPVTAPLRNGFQPSIDAFGNGHEYGFLGPVPDPQLGMSGYGAPVWPYNNATASLWDQNHVSAQETISHQMSCAQNSLTYWTRCYEELDHQLKTLDRQRAMANLNQDIATRRKELVQQRSDTKDIIDKVRTFLGMSERAVNGSHAIFNASAPSYTPTSSQPKQTAQSPPFIHKDEPPMDTDGNTNDKPQPPGKKRPIPIVPPPEVNSKASPGFEIVKSLGEDDADDTDAWGIKKGKAPPELERQQSDMLQSMVSSSSSSSHVSPGKEKSPLLLKSFSENDAHLNSLDDDSSEDESWTRTNLGRAPMEMEAAYELQLDALRQHKGIVTKIRLPTGVSIDVEGQEIQQPPVSTMSDFEKKYWSQNQVIPQVITHSESSGSLCRQKQFNALSTHAGGQSAVLNCEDTENFAIAPVGHRKAATDVLSSQFNANDEDALSSTQDETESLRDLGLAQKDRNRQILQDIFGDDPSPDVDAKLNSALRQELLHDSFDSQQSLQYRDEPLAGNMINKGYSSVSTQNVHVTARPPQNLDGATDSKTGTQLLLGFARKVKSPRTLHLSSGKGGSWFGPFRRDAVESVAGSETSSPRQRSKLGDAR